VPAGFFVFYCSSNRQSQPELVYIDKWQKDIAARRSL